MLLRSVKRVKTISGGLAELETLAARYGLPIVASRQNVLIFDEDGQPEELRYAANQKPSTKLWAIAHELGHLLAWHAYPPKILAKTTKRTPGTVWELEDELQAWNIADILLDQLNPKFYNQAYICYKQTCLKTYYR